MAKVKKQARIRWDGCKWVLELLIDGDWCFSKAWLVRHDGEDPITGDSIDWVHDSILCDICHLQRDLAYEVKVI